MPDTCPHDGDPTTCPPCQRAADQGHGPAVATRHPGRLVTFAALYHGDCNLCRAAIFPADRIARDPSDDAAYLCPRCVEEVQW